MRTLPIKLLKIGLAVSVLAVMIYTIDPAAIWGALRAARPGWIAAALALLPVLLVLEGSIWRRLLRPVAPDVSVRHLSGGLLSGYALGFMTPARAGEFAGRAFYLPRADRWSVSVTVLAQRMIDTLINTLVGGGALLYLIGTVAMPGAAVWIGVAVLGGGLGLGVAALLFFPRWASQIVRHMLPQRPQLHRRVDVLGEYGWGEMGGTVGLAVARYSVFCLQFLLLIYAFAPAIRVHEALLATALVFFIKFIIPSLTLLDLGVREGAALFFLGLFGVAEAVAFNAALLLFVSNILLPAVIGIPFVLRLRIAEPSTAGYPAPADLSG